MLQDMTKSALSLSWALSLLGLKQAINIVQPNQQSTNVFGPLAQAAAERLDDSMKDIYRSGEQIQGRVVDLAFTVLKPSASMNSSGAGASMPGMPADGGAGVPANGPMAAVGAIMSMMNPMNLINMMRGKQNCGPCEQSGQPGQQS
jgi:type IV secretory pathway TrbL component